MAHFLNFVRVSLFDWTFWLWLVIVWIAVFVVWRWGHRLLMSFKKASAAFKIVAVFLVMALLYGFGNISYLDENPHYGGWFALPFTIFLISTYILLAAVLERFRCRKGNDAPKTPKVRMRQKSMLLMAKFMFWIWSLGMIVYFMAICIGNPYHVGAEILLRPAISSLHHFAGNIDSNIFYAIGSRDILKGVISCICFTATACTFTLILSLVMSRLVAYLHIRHLRLSDQLNHVYLFFGMNDASKLLADDICSGKGDPHGIIVYVETNLTGETKSDEEKDDAKSTILSMFTHRRKTFQDIPDDNRHALAIANYSLSSIDDEVTDIWEAIGLASVKKLLRQLQSVRGAELHVFLLSEDSDANVHSVPILAKDSLIASPDYKTTIYCHARRNSVNRIVEDLGLPDGSRTEVRIIDTSHLAVEQLKSQVKNHPVEYVTVNPLASDNPGSVASPFVSLIMGFGETGQEALKFLYEYSAFTHQDATPQQSFRSPFSCHVVDKNIRDIEGQFMADIPGASYSTPNGISFYPFHHRSHAFFSQVLENIAQTLNYVVVALGDDELNMTVAVEIFRYMRKKRANLDNFRIYVRAYEKGTFTHLKEIARYYNTASESLSDAKIVLFGQSKELYTYELVVKDHFRELGRQYNQAYQSMMAETSHPAEPQKESARKVEKWAERSSARRKETQIRSNALHALTKMRLLQKAVGGENATDLAQRVLAGREGKRDTIHYPQLSAAENKLMLNLAMNEHLRWNASHEMLGYVNNETGHVCDERTKQHNCLKPWEQLDKESDEADYPTDYKLFDYGVVETSFKISLTPSLSLK